MSTNQQAPEPGWYWITGTAIDGNTEPALFSHGYDHRGMSAVYYLRAGAMHKANWDDVRCGVPDDEKDQVLRIVAPLAAIRSGQQAKGEQPSVERLMSLLREARAAIEPLTDAQIKLHRINLTLADRMDEAISEWEERLASRLADWCQCKVCGGKRPDDIPDGALTIGKATGSGHA